MARQQRCTATTQAGKPCRSFAVSERGLCVSHDPELRARKDAGSRKGGEAKANARRAARLFAAAGETIAPDTLPAMLRAAMLAVWDGDLEPARATAIATLAKTSVSLAHDLELEARIVALEEAAGLAQAPAPLRRVK